jgi:hypothetical protein
MRPRIDAAGVFADDDGHVNEAPNGPETAMSGDFTIERRARLNRALK